MTMPLDPETRVTLQGYVDGRISNSELSEWLVGAEYDEDLSQAERDELARLRLIVVEVEEQMRPGEEILKTVSEILASAGGEPVFAIRASSATRTVRGRVITAAGSPVQHAGIAP